MADSFWNGVSLQLLLNKFFDSRSRYMRKGCDGEKEVEEEEKNGDKSGPLRGCSSIGQGARGGIPNAHFSSQGGRGGTVNDHSIMIMH